MNWKHKDLWYRRAENFLVEVSRHTAEGERGLGPNRWFVYAYVYPDHPHFAAFEGDSMMQEAAQEMPFHGGPISGASYLRRHFAPDGTVTAIQVGADYNHLHDDRFTWYETPEMASDVFNDAEQLFQWLTDHAKPQPPSPPKDDAPDNGRDARSAMHTMLDIVSSGVPRP